MQTFFYILTGFFCLCAVFARFTKQTDKKTGKAIDGKAASTGMLVFAGICLVIGIFSGDGDDKTKSKTGVTSSTDSVSLRKETIEKGFSQWDGSHIALVKYVKDNMNDPDSFEHVETKYWDMNDHLVVNMKYRGKNAYGAKILSFVKAKVDLDGNVLEILDTQ